MRKIALVFAGGFCGTLARYLLSAPLLALVRLVPIGHQSAFPFDVFLINLSGSLAMGLLCGIFERDARLPDDIRLLVGTGFLGAYTTFSSLAYGGNSLLAGGATQLALVYFALSIVLGVACALIGVELAGILLTRGRFARIAIRGVRMRWRTTPSAPVEPGEREASTSEVR